MFLIPGNIILNNRNSRPGYFGIYCTYKIVEYQRVILKWGDIQNLWTIRHLWKYNIYIQIKYKCAINIVGTCKHIYFHLWPALFNLVDFLHLTHLKCKCTFRTYAGVKGQLMLLEVEGVCAQAVTEAYHRIEQTRLPRQHHRLWPGGHSRYCLSVNRTHFTCSIKNMSNGFDIETDKAKSPILCSLWKRHRVIATLWACNHQSERHFCI